MDYHFTKKIEMPFEDGIGKVTDALKKEGFGILCDIDMQEAMKSKLAVEFHPYRILGACNTPLAYQALLVEDKVGTMLPCNVVIQDLGEGIVEVSAVDPVASMMAIENPMLGALAETVRTKLRRVIESL